MPSPSGKGAGMAEPARYIRPVPGESRLGNAIRDADLTQREKAPLLGMERHVNSETWSCFPSMQTLADYVGASERYIRQGLKDLEEKGVVTRTRRRGLQSHTDNLRVNIERLEELARPIAGEADPATRHDVPSEEDPATRHDVPSRAEQPGMTGRSTRHDVQTYPAHGADEQRREQRREHTTTTTLSDDSEAPSGGGGGGDVLEGLSEEVIAARVRLLIDAGCSLAAAKRLAADPRIDDCRIEFSLRQAKQPTTKAPGKLIEKLLTMPESEIYGYGKFKAKYLQREHDAAAGCNGVHPRPAAVAPKPSGPQKRVELVAMVKEGKTAPPRPANGSPASRSGIRQDFDSLQSNKTDGKVSPSC